MRLLAEWKRWGMHNRKENDRDARVPLHNLKRGPPVDKHCFDEYLLARQATQVLKITSCPASLNEQLVIDKHCLLIELHTRK
jgi:hypothetical protein